MLQHFSLCVLMFFYMHSTFAQSIQRPRFAISFLNTEDNSFCQGERFYVQFLSDTFTAENTFRVELSDSGGVFSNPVMIGEYSGTAGNNTAFECFIPSGAVPGSGYQIRVRSSSPEVVSLPGLHTFNIVEKPELLPYPESFGDTAWHGYVYHWYSPIGTITVPVANSISFFDSAGYVASFTHNAVNFNLQFNQNALNEAMAGVSDVKGCAKQDFFAVRMKRRQYFDSGYYAFRARGDDGFRFSTNGGSTWIISSWREQAAVNQCHQNCCGVYMEAGYKDLVFEYFEQGVIATCSLTIQKTGMPVDIIVPDEVDSMSVCASAAPVFLNVYPPGGQYSGNGVSADGWFNPAQAQIGANPIIYTTGLGACTRTATIQTFVQSVAAAPTLFGADTSVCEGATIWLSTDASQNILWLKNGSIYDSSGANILSVQESGVYAVATSDTNNCLSFTSEDVEIEVLPYPEISMHPAAVSIIESADSAIFNVMGLVDNLAFQWQIDSTGLGFINLEEGGIFSGTQSNTLLISPVTIQEDGYLFRCVLSNMMCADTSLPASLSVLTSTAAIVNAKTVGIYPNPGQHSITLNNLPVGQKADFQLYDGYGRTVLQTAVENRHTSINVKHLPSGLFLYRVVLGERTFSGKWIKE